MSSIRIDNIPDSLYSRLKTAAAVNHTTIDKQLVLCLEQILMPEKTTNKTEKEKAELIIDQMGFSYRSSDLKSLFAGTE
jgi:plasmid stability protein